EEREYRDVQFDGQTADSLFEVPAGFERVTPIVTQQVAANTVERLAPDVYVLQSVAGANNNVLFVAFNDHVMVVDAPEPFPYVNASEQVMRKIKETVPGKPIKYAVLTHHHSDHSGGARGYVAEGVSIVTTRGNKSFVERMTAAPFAYAPDALARKPRQPLFEFVEGKKRVFTDGQHTVELHDIGPSPHANEMVVVYLPKEKILFQADLLNPNQQGILPFAQDAAVHLAGKIQQLGLDVERIVGAHGRIVTAQEMRASVEKRKQMDSGGATGAAHGN
ncbi:MAG: MBL fold metallo-hydrolase, partial [Pyrinomonadaceae bacterium]